MTELTEYLEVAGFQPRAAQTALYEHLITATPTGVVAQAGTGTGKSAAVIAAAVHLARVTQDQSIIITPTLTLMNQYRDGDLPIAIEAYPDMMLAEVRGMAHYECEQTRDAFTRMFLDYPGGCDGFDAGCSARGWGGHDEGCEKGCQDDHPKRWLCGYREARWNATRANVVVTNADMLIVNDRLLFPLGVEFLSMTGALLVDEAHTLEQKLRDYASRSLFWRSIDNFKFAPEAGRTLGKWVQKQDRNFAIRDRGDIPISAWEAICQISTAVLPEARPKDGLKKQREVQDACYRIQTFLEKPHDSAVLHVNQGSLKMDWINVSRSAGELLTQRSFGLVSATIPKTMTTTLGVPDAPFIDVGHPFDYGSQAWIGFSRYGGDYKSAQIPDNVVRRADETMDLIRRAKGGALILFSSFKDLEEVSARLRPECMAMGLRVFIQERDMAPSERQKMAQEFKDDGNGVLFGSNSFATGFDVPGDALRLVVLWKLPYPAVDPVSNAIRAQSYPRYEDIMRVTAIQAIGRLIRRESDRGIVWVADSRGSRLMDARDPLTSHLPQFARLA